MVAVLNPVTPLDPSSGLQADSNNQSVVLRLTWGQSSVLLTGDIGTEAESTLLRSGQLLAANVLKMAHHGSDGSSSAGFLTTVQPSFAVISAGAGNRFSHPATAVLDRLTQLGVTILRTDQAGTIELITDGERWWVKTEH